MEFEPNSESLPTNTKKLSKSIISTKKVEPVTKLVKEPRIYIQQWATERLNRSIGQLECLGAYMDLELKSGHEYDTASRFETGYLEFYRRPVLA